MMIPMNSWVRTVRISSYESVPVSVLLGRVGPVNSFGSAVPSVLISSLTSSDPGLALPMAAWRR